MVEPPVLAAVDPFAALVAALPSGGGDINVASRPGLGIVTLMARPGERAALAQRFEATCGVALPEGPAATFAGDLTVLGTGPGQWLFIHDAPPPGWPDRIADALAGVASVADQGSAYTLLRIGGAGARRLLGRGAFVDLAPESFAPGSAAVTLIAHIGVILWQIDDEPSYGVAVFRSFTHSFWHWIETAALGFGARIARTR